MKMIDTHTVMLSDETPAALCALLQDAASQHQSLLGSGREEMQSHGLLWMVMRQKLLLHRAPVSGETVTIRTWLSEARHGMYLRQYELTDAVGAALCQAAAVWALVDAESRTLAQLRLDVPLCQQECRLPRFPLLRPIETTQEYTFTVPTEYLDENGHMNNARYFDAVTPILPTNGDLYAAQIDYHLEAREGESLAIGYAVEDNSLLIQAQGDRGLCFRMKLEYQ